MYLTSEQIHAASKANMEAILSLATTQFAAIEKFANLNANVIKAAFEDSIANARALAGAKDVQELVNLQSTFAQPAIEKAIASSRSVYQVATEANAELSRAAERRVAEWKENFVALLDKAAKQTTRTAEANVTAASETVKALAKAQKGRLGAKPGKSRSSAKRRPINKAAPRRKKK